MSQTLVVPIFPLPVFLLPQGITRLRIFEARYLKMVKIASREHGFVIYLNREEPRNSHWGSWVDIVNFATGDDGILEIDVKCHSLVQVSNQFSDSDNLAFAQVDKLSHWADSFEYGDSAHLAQTLKNFVASNRQLKDLYTEQPFDNKHWVTARWLELLPVSLAVKDQLTSANNFEATLQFVNSIVKK